MKKLLSILTISTLTASVPAPLLANTPLTRVKRDIGINEKDITDGMQIQMSNIKDLSELNWTNLITNRNKRNVNSQNKHTFKTNGNINPRAKQMTKLGQFTCLKCSNQYEIGHGDWKQMEQFFLNCYKCNNCSFCFSCCNCVKIK